MSTIDRLSIQGIPSFSGNAGDGQSEFKIEPQEVAASSQAKQKHEEEDDIDADEDELLDDYIDNQILDFDEINDTKDEYIEDGIKDDEDPEFIAIEKTDKIEGEEHLDDSDTDDSEKRFDGEFVPIQKKIKYLYVKDGRGRKKNESEKLFECERHTNERRYRCETCGKSFRYPYELRHHMLAHTGVRPYSCIPCNKTFFRKHHVVKHLNTITHQQTVQNRIHESTVQHPT